MKIGLFAAQLVLPAVPGLYVILFRPGVSLLTPRMLIPSMLCINLLALLLGWRRLGWSRNERLDAAMLLVMFALFPWLEYRVLPVGAFEGNLWAQVGCYCAGQAIGYVSVVLAPDWLGRLRQRRYEERVLSGREKFRSRKEVLEQRAEAREHAALQQGRQPTDDIVFGPAELRGHVGERPLGQRQVAVQALQQAGVIRRQHQAPPVWRRWGLRLRAGRESAAGRSA